MISLDTETTGLDFFHSARPFLITISDGSNTLYWEAPLDKQTRLPRWSVKDLDEVRSLISEHDKIVLHNSKFDAKALLSIGVYLPWEKVEDTLILSHILASNQPHDLTSLALVYLGINIEPAETEMEEVVKGAKSIVKSANIQWRLATTNSPDMPSVKEGSWKYDMWLPGELARLKPKLTRNYGRILLNDRDFLTKCKQVTANYANTDSTITYHLYQAMMEKLEARKLEKIYRCRMRLLPAIYQMELHGVTLSEDRTRELEESLAGEAKKLEQTCIQLSGGLMDKLPKNGASNSLKAVLFEKFRLESPTLTEKGNPSVDKGVLEYWASTLPEGEAKTFVQSLRAYRKRQTSRGYIESYRKFWLSCKGRGKVLFTSYNPTGTDTLRWSSQNPNLQQISKQEEVSVRYCFGPSPGREWWSIDAKNIELVIPAYQSGEPALISLFENPDQPPFYGSTHLLNFSIVYPEIWEAELKAVGIEKVGPHCKKKYASTYYQYCKNGGFAIQYGAVNITKPDEWGTADLAFRRKGAHSALEFRFSKLKQLTQKQIDFANRVGYVETIPDLSVDPHRGYPLLCSRNAWGRVKETIPLSYRVQGTAMWWAMKCAIVIHEYLQQLNSSSKGNYCMIMQIHDEFVFDFPRGTGKEPWKKNLPKIRKIQKLMEAEGTNLSLPIRVGCEYHPESWAVGISL